MRRCQRRIYRHIVTLFANSRLFRTNKQRQAPILTTALEAVAIFAVEEVRTCSSSSSRLDQTGTSVDSLDIASQQIISKCLE